MQGCTVLSAALGGVGLGTVSAALASALSERGQRVLLIDGDTAAPSADIAFDFQESALYTFSDVLEGMAPEKAVYTVKEGLYVLPSAVDSEITGDIPSALKRLQQAFSLDFILVIAPFSLLPSFEEVADRVIIVSTPEERALRASEAAALRLSSYPCENQYLLLNKTAAYKEALREEPPLLETVDRVGLSLLGVCPREYWKAALSPLRKEGQGSLFGKAIRNVADRLTGRRVPLLQGIRLDGFSRRHYIERAEKRNGL